jgi:hypothetical protein
MKCNKGKRKKMDDIVCFDLEMILDVVSCVKLEFIQVNNDVDT